MTERNKVDHLKPQPSSWCEVLTNGESALSMRFAWHPDAVDPYEVAQAGNSVSSIAEPVRLNATYETTVGNNGAISTARCETSIGSCFTLTVLLEKANPVDRSYRNDIEKFMRAYFPATVGTLGCG
ncbi:hypothetical protein [Streptomyces sp. NPDC007905]|uniref:hypothetical protein n=1 Tax=Streptomyces sp. NPDC007905 TaxID=3364788 RepID=UPI0036E57C40